MAEIGLKSKLPKPLVVISAVNLVEGGTLTVLRDCLAAGVAKFGDEVRLLALVHDRDLIGVDGVEYRAYPRIKESWLRRLLLEYRDFRPLSAQLRPALWLSLHDITPRLAPGIPQAVYCHNPAPFFSPRAIDVINEPKLLIFRMLYGLVYRLNHHRNSLTVVQQEWLRTLFLSRYGARKVLLAQPSVLDLPTGDHARRAHNARAPHLIYPTIARAFKNVETVAEGFARARQRGFLGTLTVTIAAADNRYARKIVRRYGDVPGLSFSGRLNRLEMAQQYASADALLFPSRLETWGLPITEAKSYGLAILAADLPYAHETVGTYGDVRFLAANDPAAWADAIFDLGSPGRHLQSSLRADPDAPATLGWGEFWDFLSAEFALTA